MPPPSCTNVTTLDDLSLQFQTSISSTFITFFFNFHFLYDVGKSNSSVFGIQSSHGMIEIATATVTGICFSYIHTFIGSEGRAQSVPLLSSVLCCIHIVLHVLWVLVLKSCRDACWAAPFHCMFYFLPGAKLAQGSGSQRSDTKSQAGLRVLMKLQCSCSVKAILFQCWIEHQVELD